MFIFPFTSRALIIRYYRTVNGILEGDDPEAKQKGLMDKVKEMRDGLADRIPYNTTKVIGQKTNGLSAKLLTNDLEPLHITLSPGTFSFMHIHIIRT